MNHNNEVLNKVKKYIKLKRYEECIELLKIEIKNIFVNKIQQKEQNFIYTNMIDLLEKAEVILERKSFLNLKKFYLILNEECSEFYEVEILMEIYKTEIEV